jgi:aminoglycoside/choline kinase family phosphotransferase
MDADVLESTLRQLVETCVGAVDRIAPVAEHLGTRSFLRVHLVGGDSVIARIDAPEDAKGRPAGVPPEPALEPIRSFFEAAGLPVARRLGGDGSIDLFEDLGTRNLGIASAEAPDEVRRALYREACDLVPRLQRLRDPGRLPAFTRRLDDALFRYKAELFAQWSFDDETSRSIVREAFARIAATLRDAPHRLAHRDFQSSNLIVREGRDAGARLGMIDLQGAFQAPPEYDLVCLLRDSYVELPEDEVEAQLERIRPELPDAPAPDTFARRFDLLTLARKGKDHARFISAARARGDDSLLHHLPATVRHLKRAAERSARRDHAFAPLAECIAALSETPESACAR